MDTISVEDRKLRLCCCAPWCDLEVDSSCLRKASSSCLEFDLYHGSLPHHCLQLAFFYLLKRRPALLSDEAVCETAPTQLGCSGLFGLAFVGKVWNSNLLAFFVVFRSKLSLFQSRISLQKASVKVSSYLLSKYFEAVLPGMQFFHCSLQGYIWPNVQGSFLPVGVITVF